MADADVLILGSGIGGLTLALQAARRGRVLVVTKRDANETNTNMAQGGIAAVFDRKDSFERHVADTLRSGDGLCDADVVRTVVGEAPERVRDLERMGVPFDRRAGSFELGREGGHSIARIAHATDATGRAIEDKLIEALRTHPRVRLLTHHTAVDLLTPAHQGHDRRAVYDPLGD